MSGTNVLFLLKFGQTEHVSSFLEEGTIYMNTTNYFKTCQGDNERQDTNENITGHYQPKDITLSIDGRVIKELAGPVTMYFPQNDKFNASHLFCMSHIAEGMEIGDDNKLFDERVMKFGDAIAFIHNPRLFVERLTTKLDQLIDENRIHRYYLDVVKYYSKENYSGDIDIFHKNKDFEHQKEFRLAVCFAGDRKAPFSFSIGSLTDIAVKVRTSDFKNRFEVGPSGKNNIIIS